MTDTTNHARVQRAVLTFYSADGYAEIEMPQALIVNVHGNVLDESDVFEKHRSVFSPAQFIVSADKGILTIHEYDDVVDIPVVDE